MVQSSPTPICNRLGETIGIATVENVSNTSKGNEDELKNADDRKKENFEGNRQEKSIASE